MDAFASEVLDAPVVVSLFSGMLSDRCIRLDVVRERTEGSLLLFSIVFLQLLYLVQN